MYPHPQPGADLQNSISDGDPPKSFGSMIVEDIIRNMYGDSMPAVVSSLYASSGEASVLPLKGMGFRTADEVWREITSAQQAQGAGGLASLMSVSDRKEAGEMTLEDFLARAGAMIDEDAGIPSGVMSVDPASGDQFVQQPLTIENPVSGFPNGMEVIPTGGGRGRRRPMLDPEDRVTLQRQKRMIKNRESAARSRERKQAYTAELESLVHQLEQENEQLQVELEQKKKERIEKLREMVVAISMEKKPPKQLRRTNSG